MQIRRVVAGLFVIAVIYVLVLIWVDSRNHIFHELPRLVAILPILIGLTVLSHLVRYARWYWLLSRVGYKTKIFSGYLAYLSGFAFTATPGKVGELIRIRYLSPQGLPARSIISAFVFERSLDLAIVLLLSALAISSLDIFIFVLGFVVIFLSGVLLVAYNPAWLTRISAYLRLIGLKKLAHLCKVLRNGLSGCRIWITPVDVVVSAALGVIAWGLVSASFLYLLAYMDISISFFPAFAVYPLSMLAGAASMLPGGVGSTEVAIVTLLSIFDVSLKTATLAAIGIRFSSMWFSIIYGFVALVILEFFYNRKTVASCDAESIRPLI